MDRRSSLAFALATGLALLVHAVPARAATPDWVEGNGTASAYPASRFLVGFAQTTGKTEEAVEAAKQQVAADLARQVSVPIESKVVDVLHEKQGRIGNELTSQIRATTIDGERYTVIQDGADQVVRTRGIARREKKQVAERTLTLTTMRKRR